MYRDKAGLAFGAGHVSAGATSRATSWVVAERATGILSGLPACADLGGLGAFSPGEWQGSAPFLEPKTCAWTAGSVPFIPKSGRIIVR